MLRFLILLIFIAMFISLVVGTFWYFTTPQPVGLPAQLDFGRETAIYTYYDYKRGRSQDELAYLMPLADAGNGPAQTRVAELYFGLGQTNDNYYYAADTYLIKAADKGVPTAQNALGVAFRNGLGVSVDRIEAYKWFTLAARQGHALAQKNLDSLSKQLTEKEIEQGNLRIRLWVRNIKKF